jgi:hypothetical protein
MIEIEPQSRREHRDDDYLCGDVMLEFLPGNPACYHEALNDSVASVSPWLKIQVK